MPGRRRAHRRDDFGEVVVYRGGGDDNFPELVSSCLGWWVGLDMVVCGVWPLVGRW